MENSKINLNIAVIVTLGVNVLFIAANWLATKQVYFAMTIALILTLVSVLLSYIKYKVGIYDEVKGYGGNVYLVYIFQLVITAIAVTMITILL